jgi:cell wall-associated NlpC family hydrolase
MVNALSRVSEIQSTLGQLNDLAAGRVSAASGAGATSAAAAKPATTSFAEALSAATGSTATGSVTNGATGTGVSGADIVANAEKYLGVPYVFGGEDSSGMDCSGLVQRVYADAGITVPRLVSGQMTIGTEVGSLAEAKPGDLVVTGGGDHILIYAGNNQVIHAPYEGRTVSKVNAYMSESDITTIRRVIPDQVAPASTSTRTAVGAAPVGTAPTDLVAAAYATLFTGPTAGTSSGLGSALPRSRALS